MYLYNMFVSTYIEVHNEKKKNGQYDIFLLFYRIAAASRAIRVGKRCMILMKKTAVESYLALNAKFVKNCINFIVIIIHIM